MLQRDTSSKKIAAGEPGVKWHALEGHFTINSNQRILEWDDDAAALLGIPAEHAIGKLCYELVQGVDTTGRPLCSPECPAVRSLRLGHVVGRTSLRLRKQKALSSRLKCEITALPSIPGGAVARLRSSDYWGPTTAYDLAAVATLTSSLSSTSLGEGIGKTLDLLRDTVGAEVAEVFLAEPDQQGMVLTWHQGLFRHAFSQILRFGRGEGYPGLVLSTKEPILVDSLKDDPRYLRSNVKDLGFSSYVGVPLRCSWGITGSVGVAFRHPNADLQRAYNFLSWVSMPLGMAVEAYLLRLRDADWVRDNQGESFDGTLRNILTRMVALSGAQGGVLNLLDGKNGGVGRRISEGLAPRSACPALRGDPSRVCPVLASKRGIALHGSRASWLPPCQQTPRVGSVCYCVPLLSHDEVIGICQLNYYRLGALPPTWNLVPLEAAANAAGRGIQDSWNLLKHQHQTEAVVSRLLQHLETGRQDAVSGLPTSQSRNQKGETPYLDIRCFGAFELYREGTLITQDTVHRKKALTLLKILLSNDGRQLNKDTLIELLWPEGQPEVRAGQLYVLVHELRQLLEPSGTKGNWQFIRNEGDRYYCAFRGSCRVDVKEFDMLINLGRKVEAKGDTKAAAASYEAAVELYRGDFMEDEPFAEWCQQERDRLQEACLDALQRLATIFRRSGEWGNSVRYLQAALRIDPLREEVHRALMYCLWAGGRRDEAVRQYQVCKELLRRELDVPPLPETEQLFRLVSSKPGP